MQVKGNQPALLAQVQANTADDSKCISWDEAVNITGGRREKRITFVYKDLSGISTEWVGLKRLIRTERYVSTSKGDRHETAYHICDIQSNKASFFAKHIRGHWGIENSEHWVKDVTMQEDISNTASGMAAENISIIRNIAMNLFRSAGHHSIKYATELCANNFKELYRIILYKSTKCKIN
jgi:predicted transposase YbfD/YdcC